MGLKIRRGSKGTGAKHLTRASALRKLQVSLADFRRLCILKSVYPRDPKKKLKGRDKTYYHAKDILHLYHEPLLQKARELRVYERKHRRAMGRKDKAAARSLEKQRPLYSLYHIVKERYPTLVDAVRDLDDALSTAALFASLPASDERQVPVKMIADATRVLDEFLFFTMEQRLVRKVFCSIKGFYIQLKLLGQLVTFLVPHQFPQELPAEVDFKVLTTFLELYITVLRSVNFKLYRMEGFPYPPAADPDMVRAGCRFLALQAATSDSAEGSVGSEKNALEEKKEEGSFTNACSADIVQRRVEDILNTSRSTGAQRGEIRDASGYESATESNRDEDENNENTEASDDEDVNPGAGFEEDSTLQRFKALSEEDRRVQSLFSGLTFFVAREVPRVVFAFLVRSCGADAVGWQGDCSPFEVSDARITHHIIDRQLPDSLSAYKTQREFVQPQWILDSINTGLLMPVAPYAPGATLPAHLSPFVNDAEEGYMPQQRTVLDKLLNERKEEEARLAAKDSDHDDEDDTDAMCSESKEDMALEEAELHEQLHQKDIALEKRKKKTAKTCGAEESGVGDEIKVTTTSDSLQQSKKRRREAEMNEEVERRKALLSKKHKRLLNRIEFGKCRHSAKVEKLRSRRGSVAE